MTAPVRVIDPGLAAWQRIENHPATASIQDRRAAAIWAARQTARDSEWLTPTRAHRLVETIPLGLAAYQDLDSSWADLVTACGSGLGPQMLRAVEALVYGVRS